MPPGFREDIPERVIEASTRADGSVRKPIRVRAGYVNQDEVPKYRPGAFRRQKQEAEARGEPSPATPERRPADAHVRGERGRRDRPGAFPVSRRETSPGAPPESASASKPAAATGTAERDSLEAGGEGGEDGAREGGDRSEKVSAASAVAGAASPLDEWSALDEELEKALAHGGKKREKGSSHPK